jgi:hypothetical protein
VLEPGVFGAVTATLAASTGAALAIVFAIVAETNAVRDHALPRQQSDG